MKMDLINKLKHAYPTGVLEDYESDNLKNPERDARIRKVLESIRQRFPLACEVNLPFPKDKAYSISVTEASYPPFSTWIFEMRNPEKLAWIATNNGRPYPVYLYK